MDNPVEIEQTEKQQENKNLHPDLEDFVPCEKVDDCTSKSKYNLYAGMFCLMASVVYFGRYFLK